MIGRALAYAARGYEVLPLKGKIPLTAHGHLDATTDPTQITAWWEQWPNANIGCRPPLNVLICDVDPRNGGSLDQLGDYPPTRTAQTGSGGWHVWFAAVGAARASLPDVDGVDIKTRRGFVVMPPSVHPVTGRPYVWWGRSPVAPLPDHLARRLFKPPRKPPRAQGVPGSARQIAGVIDKVAGTTTERNNVLYWAARRLYEYSASTEAFDQLHLAALATGLNDDEIMRTIESAAKGTTT